MTNDRDLALLVFKAVAALAERLTGQRLSIKIETDTGTVKVTGVRNYLMFDRPSEDGAAFGSEAAGAVINEYKSSISFAEIEEGTVLSDAVISNAQEEKEVNTLELAPKGEHIARQPIKRAERLERKAGMKEDVFSLKEGDVVLQWPERLSAESYQDLEDWTQIILRKIKRSVSANEESNSDP